MRGPLAAAIEKHSRDIRRNAMPMRNLVLAHAVAAVAALCPSDTTACQVSPSAAHHPPAAGDRRRRPGRARRSGEGGAVERRRPNRGRGRRRAAVRRRPILGAVADARIVEGGGASYNRGRVVDASRADAEAARRAGVVDLTRAGELRWAQDADRVALFLPVSEDTKARSINVDVTPRALSLAVDGAQILERAPLRHGVDGEGSSWTLEDVASRCLVVELPKLDDAIVWASLLDGRSRERSRTSWRCSSGGRWMILGKLGRS